MKHRPGIALVIFVFSAFGSGCSGSDDELAPEIARTSEEALLVATGNDTLAVSDDHACVIVEGGHVKCWGHNSKGQLGLEDAQTRGDQPSELGSNFAAVDLGTGRTAKAVFASETESCAILDNDRLKCWGQSLGSYGSSVEHYGDEVGELGDNLPFIPVGTGRTVKAFSTLGASRCAILDTNHVKCWGGDFVGVTTLDPAVNGDNVPVLNLGTNRTAKAVVGTLTEGCAILDTNQVKCWGRNYYGQLGQGDTIVRGDDPNEWGDNLPVVNLGANRTVKALALGNNYRCAILDNDRLKCWGANFWGQLGLGDENDRGDQPNEMGDNLPYVNVGTSLTVKAVVGVGHPGPCVILSNNRVKCWGSNSLGALGLGDTITRGDDPGEMGDALPYVALGTNRTVLLLRSGGADTTCAVLDNRQVKCWGQNHQGQLGIGDTNSRGDGAGEMNDLLPYVPLGGRWAPRAEAGNFHNCVITSSGGVKCWGHNDKGQLGIGDVANRGDQANEISALPSVPLGTGRSVKRLTLGTEFSCALLDNGQAKCWGFNGDGALGIGDTANRGDNPGELGDALPAIPLGTGRTVTYLDAGNSHACALLDDNTMKCWGVAAALGIEQNANRGDNPGEMGDALPALNLGTGRKVISFSAGGGHSCAVLDGRRVKCWGSNGHGQLGLGDTQHRGNLPGQMGDALPQLSLLATVKEVSCGYTHSCALKFDGRVQCWGSNTHGELGIGDTQHRGDGPGEMGSNLPFVDLGTGRTARKVVAGYGVTCAWLDNDQVKCWGRNSQGNLGLGDVSSRGDGANEMGDNLPFVSLGTGRSARSFTLGLQHACVGLDTTQFKCWGFNNSGQLGLGNTVQRGDNPNEMGDSLPTLNFGPVL
jgi:alpha-tubulin suppressor-like RCC1 family protein